MKTDFCALTEVRGWLLSAGEGWSSESLTQLPPIDPQKLCGADPLKREIKALCQSMLSRAFAGEL
jgi:hypothetical protein